MSRSVLKLLGNEVNSFLKYIPLTMSSEKNPEEFNYPTNRLGRDFFDVPCTDLAKNLLGQILMRKYSNLILSGRIIETEAYLGGDDLASHTRHGKKTNRTAPAYMDPGTIYVYSVYGMYYLFNISSKGDGACVLIRSLEPISGLEEMKAKRASFGKSPKKQSKIYKFNQICNGPSKLAISMSIDNHFSGKDLVISPEIWIEAGKETIPEKNIVNCPRIGVDIGGLIWAKMPLRYYILDNKCVSKRDRNAENSLRTSK